MFSYIDTNSSLQQSHPNHISHHHSHLSAHHPHQQGPPQPLSLDSNTQLPMLQSDGSPISAQMVSLTSAPLSVNSNMLHGLVANPTQVHSQSMMVNGGHMYSPAEEYTAMQSHYSVQATTAPQPPPPPPPPVQQTQPPQNAQQTPNSGNNNKKRKVSEVQSATKSIHNGSNSSSTGNGNGASNVYIKQEPTSLSPDSALHSNGNNSCTSSNNGSNVHSTQQCEDEYYDYGPDSQMYADSFYQCIRFTAFNPTSSCTLYDVNFKEV